MATEEQLKVTISTVADTAAVQRYGQEIKKIQQQGAEASALQAQISRAGGFDAYMRSVTQPSRAAAETTRRVGESARLTASELARFGAQALGVGVGLSLFGAAGASVNRVLGAIVQTTISLDQAQRLNTITLGSQATAFQQWAASTGLAQRSLFEAGTAAQQFGRQIGLMPDQVQNLVSLSVQLARALGTDVGPTMTELTAAMQGNAQAANALGLNLDDAYVAYTQLGAASAEVFKQLPAATQETLRYRAALEQTAAITRTLPGPVQDLHTAQNQLNAEWERLATQIGPPLIETLAKIAGGFADVLKNQAPPQGTDPGFKNELALLEQVRQKIVEINATPGVELLRHGLPETAAGPPAGQGAAIVRQDDIREARAAQQAASIAQAAQQQAVENAQAGAVQNVVDLTAERVRLQHDAVNLTAEEARIRLSALPAQQRMAELQRDITEQQIRARQAALPASEALEDLRFQEQRLRLELQARGLLSPEQRAAARRELRGLARAEPGAELAALEAGRGVTLAGRAAARLGMQAQLEELANQRALAPVQGAQQQAQLISAIVAAELQAAQQYLQELTVVVNLQIGDKTQQFITQADLHAGVQAASNASSNRLAGTG